MINSFKQSIRVVFPLLLFFVTTPLLAKAEYGMAGCGLGSLIFKDNSAFPQSLASTSNNFLGILVGNGGGGIFGFTQSFAISSGTSNCIPSGKSIAEHKQGEFLKHNLSLIAKESSRGEGEMLSGFAQTFGCSQEAIVPFKQTLQRNYQHIFGVAGAEAILEATRSNLKQEARLVGQCKYI